MSEDEGKKHARYPQRRRQQLESGKNADEDMDVQMRYTDEDEESKSDDDETSDELGENEQDFELLKKSRRKKLAMAVDTVRRKSSRANKYSASMKEPQGISDLFPLQEDNKRASGRGNRKGRSSNTSADSSEEVENGRIKKDIRDSLTEIASSNDGESDQTSKKKTTRKSTRKRASSSSPDLRDSQTEESDNDDQSSDGDGSHEKATIKIQRILASRSKRRKEWNEICAKMNTTEIDSGSLWYQKKVDDDKDGDEAFEERFLVKWADHSYMHVSWETAKDLEEQTENFSKYLSTFFRKSKDGLLFSADERCDGEYFDPAFTQIDRILEVDNWPSDKWSEPEREDKVTMEELGIITDKSNPGYEKGLGRMFYIKWMNQPYDEATFEHERDLIMNEIEYKDKLKAFFRRVKKPTKQMVAARAKEADAQKRKLYKIFGEGSNMNDEDRNEARSNYQQKLRENVYKNGGQLRDYQAEGVSWMISNYLNDRSCILADEMGLGKTLQTAASASIIQTQLKPGSLCLIIAPLSTIPHWLREFQSWTDLNCIVYHGTLANRQLIREWEMAYEEYRSANRGPNYLRRCKKKKAFKSESPWMVQVVIATPEMLVTDDAFELSEIDWEILVVDEAHRLKNHNSKLALNLRDPRFSFKFKILATGTPIQNNMQELWTLLHFIDSDKFGSMDDFLKQYGNMKSKDTVDELHETLRPYILRRLKEDVEKSMPPKEETIIEVELTLSQKQYYRALYEKNVKFLHKGKSKALDGPSLNNLAMQLRKCCNHVCLLNGIEEELRKQHTSISDTDFLVKGSGKLILLDKLLPRLNEEGHRVLIFSQFKIMLDILEDYLVGRGMTFGRIDGSITGLKRQAAIDAFQSKKENAPFIMMLSTRAGGVGINLTAADTVIIFDSDWNPQNDLQAQARCHRIGQERDVKVYRLLSARTYEMQMFDLSSMKMGLDQAVLKGFESGSESALTKAEVEKLLKHGAYAMITEEKDGKSESATNEFVEQDIDSILQRRARTVVHDGLSKGGISGGTFSKASFKVNKSPDKKEKTDDVDIEDPEFWKKMLGDAYKEPEVEELDPKQRRRVTKNYSEDGKLDFELMDVDRDPEAKDADYCYESVSSSEDNSTVERAELGGPKPIHWDKDDVERLERFLYAYGYSNVKWETAIGWLKSLKPKGQQELKRMAWSLVLAVFVEAAQKDALGMEKKAQKNIEKQREAAESAKTNPTSGGVLVSRTIAESTAPSLPTKGALLESAFQKLWRTNFGWKRRLIDDAVDYAKLSTPRDPRSFITMPADEQDKITVDDVINLEFAKNVWKSLQHRGWKATLVTEGPLVGKSVYSYKNESFGSIADTVNRARVEHPELVQALDNILNLLAARDQRSADFKAEMRSKHLLMTAETATYEGIQDFFRCYAPFQLVFDREKSRSINIGGRRLLVSCFVMSVVFSVMHEVIRIEGSQGIASIESVLSFLKAKPQPKQLPHPEWTVRHDAVLLQALYKHGYIDLDPNYQGVLQDKRLVWGVPFDSVPARSPAQVAKDKASLLNILCVANRAQILLQKHGNSDIAKDINKASLAQNFCLKYADSSAGEIPSSLIMGNGTWTLDTETLTVKLEKYFCKPEASLPSKKELTKRAIALATCLSSGTSKPDETDTKAVETQKSFGQAVLDLNDPANFLLVELIRALLKAQCHNKESKDATKMLFSLALEESRQRATDLRQQRNMANSTDEDLKKACDAADRIIKQILVAEASISLSPRLFKNALRVMIGEPPVASKISGDPLFPPEHVATPDLNLASLGRLSVEQSRDRYPEIGDMSGDAFSSEVLLTEAETVVLLTACAIGIPVWTEQWQSHVPSDVSAGEYIMAWEGFGSHAISTATWTQEKARKACEDALNVPVTDEEGRKRATAAKLHLECVTKAREQVEEYEAEPLILAKKTILMLNKILKKIGVFSFGAKSDHVVGHKVPKWMSDQVFSWSQSFGLVDPESGDHFTLTAVDFLSDLSQDQRSCVDVTVCLDKQSCGDVFNQIASVSRLRAIMSTGIKDDAFLARTQRAGLQIAQKDGAWEFQPKSWTSGTDDVLLLRRLLKVGSYALAGSGSSCGIQSAIATTTFRNLNLSEAILQSRANTLIRELHDIEDSYGAEVPGLNARVGLGAAAPVAVPLSLSAEVKANAASGPIPPQENKRKELLVSPNSFPGKKIRLF